PHNRTPRLPRMRRHTPTLTMPTSSPASALTATSGAMALATAARRQAWDWLLLLILGTVLPLLVALGLFLSSMQAYYKAPSGLVGPLLVGLLLLTALPIVLLLVLASLTTAAYGIRAVQWGRLTAAGALPARPSRLSRRQLLVIVGMAILGGAAWLVTHALLPDHLTSLGFVRRIKGRTAYIVPPLVGVPAGEFLMGSHPATDRHAHVNQHPHSPLT